MALDKLSTIFLLIDAAGGEIKGRTAVQKLLFFASTEVDVAFKFSPHYYGPYSESLAASLNDLVAAGFLVEHGKPTSYGNVIYSYRLTSDGQNVVNELKGKYPDISNKFKKVIDVTTEVADNNTNTLSWAAKIYYMLKTQGKKISYSETQELARKYGWELTTDEINAGVKLLSALHLASKQ